MNEISNLGYFLNSIKKTLPFEDTEDFKKKIDESKEFRIKVQKLVYLSKFFGWDNSYHFNFHENGPYSCQLSEDYRSIDSFNDKKHDYNFDNDKFKEFTMNQDTGYFESTSSILYYLSKMNLTQINKNEIISVVTSLKPHLSKDTILKSYENILKFDLVNYTPQNSTFDDLNTYEKIVKDKSKGLMSIFERYDVCSNRLFLLGSLDYFTFVLKHENVDAETRSELLKKLYDYAEEVEKEYFLIHPSNEELINIDLSNLEHHFDLLQDYISKELRIIPKLDENTDLSIFFEG